MSALERCRTAAFGGHVERCEACAHLRISYNSCRNRHCPKCQAAAAKEWLAARQAELLPVPYFHVVLTLPQPIAHIIVPGGGFSPDRQHWITCRPSFLLSVRVLSRLFRRLFLEGLTAAYQAGRLQFFADQAALAQPAAFKTHLAALRKL